MFNNQIVQFKCESVNLFNTNYYLTITPTQMIISKAQNDANPKYVLPFKDCPVIRWNLSGFSFTSSNGKLKTIKINKQNAIILKNLLRLQVFSSDIKSFFIPVKILGQGLTAKVYLTKDKQTGEYVAVKSMLKEIHKFNRFYNALVNEINIMKSLTHQNIIKLLDTFESQNHYHLILEYFKGVSLNEFLNDLNSNKSFQIIQKILFELVKAIQYLHKKKILHRDIKPSNILIDVKNEIVKLIDFGFAIIDQSPDYIYWKCGTPGYMAPEVQKLEKKNQYSLQVDIYSLGITIFECLIYSDDFTYNKQKHLIQLQSDLPKSLSYMQECNVNPVVIELIRSLVNPEPHQRPCIDEIVNNIFFKLPSLFIVKNQKLEQLKEFIPRRQTPDKSVSILLNGFSNNSIIELQKQKKEKKDNTSILSNESSMELKVKQSICFKETSFKTLKQINNSQEKIKSLHQTKSNEEITFGRNRSADHLVQHKSLKPSQFSKYKTQTNQ